MGGRPVTRDENTGEEQQVELNTQVIVSSREFRLPEDFEVAFQSVSKQVKLEGGEALLLKLNRNGDDMISLPFLDDVVAYDELVHGSADTPTDYLMRVHRPRRSGNRVNFRISVQDQGAHFTPRPQEIWVEVVPDRSSEKYLFYDAFYEPDTPVPVVQFTASNWPQGVDSARIRFWCRQQMTEPIKSIPLATVRGRDFQNAPFQPVPTVPQVTIRAGLQQDRSGQYRVQVDEQYARDAGSMAAIRVWLDIAEPSLKPRSIRRRFDLQNRVARHHFEFESPMSERDFSETMAVVISSTEDIKESALHLKGSMGLEVPIFDEDATHAPSSTSASQ